MRRKLAIIFLVLGIIFSVENNNTTQANVAVGFNLFFGSLSPYGNWVSVPTYGNVWYPTAVGPHWRPYTDGRWVWSDYGWTWASYEPWGWAPYHFGRWVFLEYYGWVWIPGTVWAPSWVTWYTSPGYIGWAPLAPDNDFFLQIGIGFNSYDYYIPPSHCVFVPSHEFLHHSVNSVVIPQSHNVKIFKEATHINNVRIVNNNVVNRGPDVGFVERVSRTKVEKVNLVEKDIDTDRIVKTRANVNKLDEKNYYIFKPDVVRKDKGTVLPNGEAPKKALQIENTDNRFPSDNKLQYLPNRNYAKVKKESLKNSLRIRDDNDHSYSNNKIGINNDEKYQKKENIKDAPDKRYNMHSENKKRNSLERTYNTHTEHQEEDEPNYSNVKRANNNDKGFSYQNNANKSKQNDYPINLNKRWILSQEDNTNQFQNLGRQPNRSYGEKKNQGRKSPKESRKSEHNELD
ncbi:MAG: DUF6600 domain-containing protein [Thermodesulfobacteriota bacterium]